MENGDVTKIHIVSTNPIPIFAIVSGFYTTAVVNVLSWNKAYSIFPDATFISRPMFQLYQYHYSEDIPMANLAKYEHRGWRLSVPTDISTFNSAYMKVNGVRHIGDPKTWTIVLDISDIEPSTTPDFVIESAFFDMSCMRRAIGVTTKAGTRVAYYYLVRAFEYEASVLKHI